MANRRRDLTKEALWRRHIEQQARGGMSIRRYCRMHGLSEPSFHTWKRELRRRAIENQSTRTQVTLVPVTVVPDELEVSRRAQSRPDPVQQPGRVSRVTAVPERSTPPEEAINAGRAVLELQVADVVILLREDVPPEVLGRVVEVAVRVGRPQRDDCRNTLRCADGDGSC